MGGEPREDVMRILPHRFRHDERRIRRHFAKNFDTHPLRVDEAVALRFIERMRALHAPSFFGKRAPQRRFHLTLRRPADLIRGDAQVAAGDETDRF